MPKLIKSKIQREELLKWEQIEGKCNQAVWKFCKIATVKSDFKFLKQSSLIDMHLRSLIY